MVKTFVKKPVEICAVQWTGYNFDEIANFVERDEVCFIGNQRIQNCLFLLWRVSVVLQGED